MSERSVRREFARGVTGTVNTAFFVVTWVLAEMLAFFLAVFLPCMAVAGVILWLSGGSINT